LAVYRQLAGSLMNATQPNKFINWTLFLLLSIIWGSSFILMKRGMYTESNIPTLSAYHVAAIRILSAGLALLPYAIWHWRKIPRKKAGYVVLSGFLGSFIPAFLFCIAETKIDSALAGFLNALTPIFTIVVGILFYNSSIPKGKLLGVIVAFLGMILLFLSSSHISFQYLSYAGFALVATICYGFNVNIANTHLKEIGSAITAAIAFGALIIPSLLVLIITGYFKLPLGEPEYIQSTLSATVLGVMGTAVATILFYMLLKKAGALFASMVTYGIPFIALGWGLLAGESITLLQVVGLAVILLGVYLTKK